ncbi:hypothetical protein NI25_20595 [Streptomyces sp. CCM_MD2014]|nr:hypothetical protein NI25_20595 [Streptomyces sp. CCM_MD2014]
MLGDLLGGDEYAYRYARALRREGIEDVEALRAEYERPVPWVGAVKGHALLDIRGFGPTALARVAAALADGREVSERHVHAPLEDGADVVTLCGTTPAEGGTRSYHLPVSGALWWMLGEEARQDLRGRVWRELGEAYAVVDPVGPLLP